MKKIYDFNSPTIDILLKCSLEFQLQFDTSMILNSNDYKDDYGKYNFLAAFGAVDSYALDDLNEADKQWKFGNLNYNLKDEFFSLRDKKEKRFSFSNSKYFVPETVLIWKRGDAHASILSNRGETKDLIRLLNDSNGLSLQKRFDVSLKPRMQKEEYINHIQRLKKEIQYGNIYEINYCQEFFQEECEIKPESLFYYLSNVSPVPFSAFYKQNEEYLLSFSPERYFCKRRDSIYSQPIKGTARRGIDNQEDEEIKEKLKNDIKEQTENVMIVDLVRNDLSRTAKKSSVKVEELFGLYTFPKVHQLISTVSSKLREDCSIKELIRTSFPMGSMTGVPKYKALSLIDELEPIRREAYSGSVGYIDPEGDADFNVIIRSLVYSKRKKYLSLMVGGAITNLSDPELEYQECLIKADAFLDLKNGSDVKRV